MVNFNLCEYVNQLSHEANMGQLVNVINGGQDACTDTDCIETGLPGRDGRTEGSDGMLWAVGAIWLSMVIMYYVRGMNRMRGPSDQKPRGGGGGQGNNGNDGPGGSAPIL